MWRLRFLWTDTTALRPGKRPRGDCSGPITGETRSEMEAGDMKKVGYSLLNSSPFAKAHCISLKPNPQTRNRICKNEEAEGPVLVQKDRTGSPAARRN